MSKRPTTVPKEKTDENRYLTAVEIKSRELLSTVSETEKELNETYQMLDESYLNDKTEKEIKEHCESFRKASRTTLKAYQKMIFMNDELATRFKDLQKSRKRKFIPSPPANASIDIAEKKAGHFAQGLNLYKILLLCFIGSFSGVILEMLWWFVTTGKIESRAGLVYGPFNLLYGLGAVCMTAALYSFRNRGILFSFCGGFLVGSVVEYACSFFQEQLLGSVSWDYSNRPFNLNGRICLTFSFFWGLLGIIWMKNLYPWVAKLILKIPNKVGKTVTIVLTAFLAVNGIITIIAVYRWSQRIDFIPSPNAFFSFIDARFTDARMARIFPNMKF